ncbi:hypothetical protein HII31_07724 [Pseudocercospora fuligena]|uniref:BTB domain-containing protein n=1 Tax=Pseudocercospora fuligena TaxID=685502 RepID=A0A8H6VKZ4_9PEZI|nr:hypothetical protein HII31_07724 [Pseudocercospora fuligena]
MVQRIYHTSELADLVVQSDTRAFKAHRDIVFELLPSLQATCVATPEDCLPFFVRIPASEQVVEAMLRHLYQLDVILPFEDLDDAPSVAEAGRLALDFANGNCLIHACEGLLTCTKYGIHELADRFQRAILGCMFFARDADDLLPMADMAHSFSDKMVPEELMISWKLDVSDKLVYTTLVILAFEADRIGGEYDVTGDEIEEIIGLETMRRKFETAHRRQR